MCPKTRGPVCCTCCYSVFKDRLRPRTNLYRAARSPRRSRQFNLFSSLCQQLIFCCVAVLRRVDRGGPATYKVAVVLSTTLFLTCCVRLTAARGRIYKVAEMLSTTLSSLFSGGSATRLEACEWCAVCSRPRQNTGSQLHCQSNIRMPADFVSNK